MACICKPTLLAGNVIHSLACDEHNRCEVLRQVEWDYQDHQCTGSGYSHKPHGKCSGYATDRT